MNRKTPKVSIHTYISLKKQCDDLSKDLSEIKQTANNVAKEYLELQLKHGELTPHDGKITFKYSNLL
jgi:hypothetical protein